MKRFVQVLLLAMLFSVLSPLNGEAKFEVYWLDEEAKFADVYPNSPHYLNITRLTENNIMKGISKNKEGRDLFKPNENITKRQIAQVMARALKIDGKKTGSYRFGDIAQKDTDFNTIHALTQLGVFDKTKNFNPNSTITREELSKIISKAFQLTSKANVTFKDVSKTSTYYESIQQLAKAKIVTPDTQGKFNPKNKVSRSQFATFLQRGLDTKQYLNAATSGLLSQKEKEALSKKIDVGREVYYDLNPFGDENEIAHFLYLNIDSDSLADREREEGKYGYIIVSKSSMDNHLKNRYGFTIANPEKLKQSIVTYDAIDREPTYFENRNYYLLNPSTTGTWGRNQKSFIDSAVKVKNNMYYGLGANLSMSRDEAEMMGEGFNQPFSKWAEADLKELYLVNYYYFVAVKIVEPAKPPFAAYETYDIVYRDREGFKTKEDLEKFAASFTKIK